MKPDLAIRWLDGAEAVRRVRRSQGVPVRGRPNHLLPGRSVALVQRDGRIALRFVLKSLEGPKTLTLVNGKRSDAGYLLVPQSGTMRGPRAGEAHFVGIRWRAMGQFRYCDLKSGKPLVLGKYSHGDERPTYIEDAPPIRFQLQARPYSGPHGLPWLNKPERDLVDEYVRWCGGADGRFVHPYFRSDRTYADLLDRRFWRLFEAKALPDRHSIRQAIGQLLDYRRFLPRRPSLGVLLAEKPSSSNLELLRECRVTAIWRTESGRFRDSSSEHAWSIGARL